ncbi:D-alanyl-D-alanine carboxypeptidase family protein [Pseudolysinimonas sp.]|jgi:D-alanyl-D-alanine carboxypeptidase (penicillin-binding protein 5/6)|uniref:D-alanyl-D-alanine carboxypeptidase family protein n=1 Tax=Pseudolysinimonas sp. TaxID=2680009 RepID=UPI003783BAEE
MRADQGPTDGVSRLTELMRYEPPRDEPPPAPVDPVRRRRRRRRRGLVAGIVGLVIASLLGGYSAYALTAPIGNATLDAAAPAVDVPAAAQIAIPGGAFALSVSGADEYLGPEASGIWMSAGDAGPQPMASITKVITALVILEAKPLAGVDDPGPTITFTTAQNALYDKYYLLGATIARMTVGASMSERDALEAMLIISASNYAEVVSTWAYGSQGAFLSATRDWLAANGLAGTTIVEPTGIDPRNVSTPADLIALGRIVAANPVIAQIVGTPTLDVPVIPPGGTNTNELLGVDGITGIKTGTLEEYGANLLFSATLPVGTEQPLQLIGVVMGHVADDALNRDVRALLASIREGFHTVVLGEQGDQVGTYTTAWGESAGIRLGDGASVLTWSDTPITVAFEVDPLTTGDDGDEVGTVTWTVGTETLEVPLVLDGSIRPPDAWWRLTHPFELGG